MSSRKRWGLKSWDHERQLSDEGQDDTLLNDDERQWRRISPAQRCPLPAHRCPTSEVARNLERLTKRGSSVNTILKQLQSYNEEGSNRRFQRVTSLEIHLNRYKTLGGLSYIKLPSKIAKEKAILNIKNKDEECFRWYVLRHLNPVKSHPERVSGCHW